MERQLSQESIPSFLSVAPGSRRLSKRLIGFGRPRSDPLLLRLAQWRLIKGVEREEDKETRQMCPYLVEIRG